MNTSRLFAGLLLAGITTAAIGGDTPQIEELLTMRVEGTVSIDAQGNVSAHTVDSELPPSLREFLDKAIAQWKFKPPTVDGKPVRAKSNMRITLAARANTDGSSNVKVDNVLFYERHRDDKGRDIFAERANADAEHALWKDRARMSVRSMTRRIEYPRGYNVSGAVTMVVQASPDGTVVDVVPTQCSLFNARATKEQLDTACKTLSTMAAKAIRTWKIDVQLNGTEPTPEALSATIPLVYYRPGDRAQTDYQRSEGRWRAEARTPYKQAPWLKKDGFTQQVGTSDVENGEMIPSRSTLQFRDG